MKEEICMKSGVVCVGMCGIDVLIKGAVDVAKIEGKAALVKAEAEEY